MARHIVFLIHGIGEHKPGWASEKNGPIDTLKKISRNYGFFQSKTKAPAPKLDDFVDFVPLDYDDILEGAVAKWKAQGQGLSGAANLVPLLKTIGTWINSVPDEAKELFWTHVADIGIYWMLKDYREYVRTRLLDQMAKTLEAHLEIEKTAPQSTVIAHSLGTTVAHDVVHALGAQRWADEANPLGPTHWQFNALFMLANTSHLLETEYPVYESIARPGPVATVGRYCSRYYNIRHEFDPVPVPLMFSPDQWGPDLRVVDVKHFRGINIHDFGHHLLHPEVHIPILQTLVHPGAVTKEEASDAVKEENFPQWDMPEVDEALRNRLSAELSTILEEIKTKTKLEEFLVSFHAYVRLLREIEEGPATHVNAPASPP